MLIYFIVLSSCFSQNSNAGKEFAICFPINDDFEKVGAVLNLSLINNEDEIANIKIYTNLDGKVFEYIIPAKESINIKMDSKYELTTLNGIEKNSVLIKSDKIISVIGLSRTQSSAGAYLALPINVLDTNYIISNLRNRNKENYAQISIVGIYDSTKINIKTKTKLKDSIINILDNPDFYVYNGDVLILSANEIDDSDFTGTLISSNFPISVFASHKRTSIPFDHGYQDHIIEQVPPLSVLGIECYFTPTKFPLEKSSVLSRIVSAFDSTKIKVGTIDTVLNKFEFLEYKSNDPFVAIANKPVLFSQFEKSARLPLSKGDPFLIYNTPKEQWLNNYTFYSSELLDFTEHWINIIIHSDGLSSLRIDNQQINLSIFNKIPNTNYYWAPISVLPGFHKVSSDSLFSLLVYGYGTIMSYGYSGGMKADRLLEKILDNNVPQLKIQENCSTLLEITENNEYDSGIDIIEIIEFENLIINMTPYKKGDKLVNINLSLIDDIYDSYVVFNIYDIKGHHRSDTIHLHGFNISINFQSFEDSLFYLEFKCDTIRFVNLGNFVSNFSFYFEDNTNISIPPSYHNMSLKPGQDTLIPLCVRASTSAEYVLDKLILLDTCDRKIHFEIKYSVESQSKAIDSRCGVKLEFIVESDIKSLFLNKSINLNSFIQIIDLKGSEVYSGVIDNFPKNLYNGIYFILIFENNEIKNRFIVSFE